MYVVGDILGAMCLWYVASHFFMLPTWLSVIVWPVFWFAQGAVLTGLWVIAHECGHQAFSSYKWLNDAVGLVLHSLLLVPYHSWRITHSTHHKSTSHIDKDQVFVPKTYSSLVKNAGDIHHLVSDSPLVNLVQIVLMVTVGWWAYILTNAFGQDYGRRTNHLEPSSPVFKPEHRNYIILSDVALVLVLSLFAWICYTYSVVFFLKYYFVPYLWVNFWLVLITYLHHTDVKVPHYRGEEWSFIRGALCTVDRDYGFLNVVLHHIGDTHVAHHLFSTMPHYHCQEATKHLKALLGRYYIQDNTPILTAVWRNWKSCHFVSDKGDILYYQTLVAPKKQ